MTPAGMTPAVMTGDLMSRLHGSLGARALLGEVVGVQLARPR
jgi:hypothetical protein